MIRRDKEVSLDSLNRALIVGGVEIRLTLCGYNLMKRLLSYDLTRGKTDVVPYSECITALWPTHRGRPYDTRADLRVHMSRMNKRLREAGVSPRIKTRWGMGCALELGDMTVVSEKESKGIQMNSVQGDLIVKVVDGAISKSKFCLNAWSAIRLAFIEEREPTLDELSEFQEAVEKYEIHQGPDDALIVDLRRVF